MPGLASSSALTSDPISVTAREIFFLIEDGSDRKSTRLNSSHLGISYAVFCLKKKNKKNVLLSTYQRRAPLHMPLITRNGCGLPWRTPKRTLPFESSSLLLHVITDDRYPHAKS